MICSDLFASARKAVFPAPTATGVHRLRNTWSSLLSQPVANYASFTSRIQVHGKGPRKNKVGATATGGSGCGGWGRRNLPQKSSTVLSEPKISLSPLGYSTSEPEKTFKASTAFFPLITECRLQKRWKFVTQDRWTFEIARVRVVLFVWLMITWLTNWLCELMHCVVLRFQNFYAFAKDKAFWWYTSYSTCMCGMC